MPSRPLDSNPGEEPQSVADSEVDYRFTLANERTMLAWLRTALALIAGGVAVETFAVTLEPKWLPGAIGIFAIAIGAILAIVGYTHWVRTQRAMSRGDALPAQHAAPIVTVGIVIVAVGLIIGMFL